MKLVTGIIALAVALSAALLWKSGELNGWLSTGLIAGAGVGTLAVIGFVVKWFRSRRRRQITDMRDSALW